MTENTLCLVYTELTKAFVGSVLEIDYNQIQINKRVFNRYLVALINLKDSTRLVNMFSYQCFLKIIK